MFIEPARTTFTYQAEHSLVWDLTTSVNVTNDANTGERLGISNAVQTNEWLCMVQSELSAFDALRRLSLDLIDYRSRHYRRALTLDQAKQLQNSLLNYKNKLWNIKQRNGNRGKGVLNSTSSNVLLGKQMLFVNFETQQVHSPNIRSGEFTIPDKKLILLRQVVFRDLNVDVLARIISNDNDGYNDLVGTAATQKSLALTSPRMVTALKQA